jgi:hypothetical protein
MMYYSNGSTNGHSVSVTIRAANAIDRASLRRVAERDSRAVPQGDLLVAEVDGELRAAIELESGEVIADPFRPTAELVRMLTMRRSQLPGDVREFRHQEVAPAISARPC